MERVLITGGTRGIGRQAAILFKKSGYDVFVTYVKSSDEAEKLEKIGINTIMADVSDFGAMLEAKKIVANTAVVRLKKLPEPCEPNTVAEAPEPKEAPASAPLPC